MEDGEHFDLGYWEREMDRRMHPDGTAVDLAIIVALVLLFLATYIF